LSRKEEEDTHQHLQTRAVIVIAVSKRMEARLVDMKRMGRATTHGRPGILHCMGRKLMACPARQPQKPYGDVPELPAVPSTTTHDGAAVGKP
jgi:hypothetical protein